MRYTAEKNPRVQNVPAGEIWVGVLPADEGLHVAIATRSHDEDDLVLLCRFTPAEATSMGQELISLAMTVNAPNN